MERVVLRGGADAVSPLELRLLADAFALIVEADDVHPCGERHVRLGKVHRRRHGARRVFGEDDAAQARTDGGSGRVGVLLAHLVANAPDDDGRVVAVAADHGAGVLLAPVVENEVEVVGRLLALPRVEHLVDDKEAHAVAEVEQLGRGRIVGQADSVATGLGQELELAFGGATVEGRTKAAEVVVLVDAL